MKIKTQDAEIVDRVFVWHMFSLRIFINYKEKPIMYLTDLDKEDISFSTILVATWGFLY